MPLLTPFLPPTQPFAAKGSVRSDIGDSKKKLFCCDFFLSRSLRFLPLHDMHDTETDEEQPKRSCQEDGFPSTPGNFLSYG